MISLHRMWQFLIVFLSLTLASLGQGVERGPQGTIRVGIFHVEPFNIIDQNKTPAGLNVDLLKEISRKQQWTPQFVPVTWVEGLEGLQNEQIDLMVSVAYTPERAEVMDYSHESVLELWGQVFVRPEGKLKNINDLAGLRVGVMRKDINGSNFIKTAESLGVHCEIVEFPSYVEVFAAIEKKDVDAGVAHQHYGLRHAKAYNLVGSAMIFSPISIYFASKKGKHHELLGNIDAQLSQWKRDKDSYYYERVDYWLGVQSKRTKIPLWLVYAALAVALFLLVVSAFTLLLGRKVKIRTAELHESEMTFRKLFEDSSDAILLIDKSGVFVECNQAALDLLKMTREQFLFLPPTRISPEFQPNGRRSAEAAPEMIALAYTKGLHRFDWTCVNAQGGEFVVEVALMPISIKGQTMLHTSWRDITERKRTELALRDSEEKFRQMTEGVREVFWLGSLDWQEVYYVSPAYTTVWGGDITHLYQHPLSWLDGVIAEDKEKVRRAIPADISTSTAPIVFPEYRIRRNDGALVWISAKAFPVLDAFGKPYRIAGIAEDITERKNLEAERQKFFLLAESSSEFIGMCDLQMQPVYVNPAGRRMVGLPDMATACRVKVQDYYFPEDQAFIRDEFFPRVLREGRGEIEISLRHFQTGEPIWISACFFIVRDSSNEALGWAIVSRDIGEKKRAEQEKKLLQAQLQQAQKLEAIGTLAGGIAHDFNNILGAIVGYAEILRDDLPPGSPSLHDIDQVLKASFRAKDLVKQILAFSRQVEDQKIPVHPAVIVREAIILLRSSLPTTITITQDIDADAGMVLANPTQIHQVIMNLATNAFHAMEARGGTLTIFLGNIDLSREDLATEPEMQPGRFVQLSVSDTGEGIPPEIRERIFDPFFTTKEVGKGTGLGLSMVYSIVKGSGGTISCFSRLGEGTEFRIHLPIFEGESAQENGSAEPAPHGKEHILLIDDEEMLVELGQEMLKRLGYRVTTRTNSLDALTTFQNQPDAFDLIITDQTMAGMTGVDLARRILQIRPDMPIILCTGYSSQISEEKAKAAGIQGFAYKPLAKKEMGELIRRVLG